MLLFVIFIALAGIAGLSLNGCTASSPAVVITPLENAGCAVENTVAGGLTGAIAGALHCSNSQAIQASLMTALGNANLCSVAAAQAAKAKEAAKPGPGGKPPVKGPIGNLVCPLAVNVAVGFVTASVPTAWGCSSNSTMSAVAQALTSACEILTPI